LAAARLRRYAQCPAMDIDIVTRFLFPAPPASYTEDSFPGELLWVPCESSDDGQGCAFPCLFLECGRAKYLLLYFHRNAEDLGTCRRFVKGLRDELYVHVLAVEYPGYGPQPNSTPSAAKATQHAFAAYSFVRKELRWPREHILIFGCSVGTGPALSLAAQEEVAGIILFAPFLSIREAVRDRVGTVIASLITEQFPNNSWAPQITSPTLIVHGLKDKIIPSTHGEQLYDCFRCRKALVSPYDLDHNSDLLQHEWFLLRPMMKFFPLPDYTFQFIRLPSWALKRSQAVSRPSNCSKHAGPGPIHVMAPVPQANCHQPDGIEDANPMEMDAGIWNDATDVPLLQDDFGSVLQDELSDPADGDDDPKNGLDFDQEPDLYSASDGQLEPGDEAEETFSKVPLTPQVEFELASQQTAVPHVRSRHSKSRLKKPQGSNQTVVRL